MEYTKLGLTELNISRIGFGCWAIGGHGYGRVDDKESIKAIQRALDLGINFFDTADVYGFGYSEEILSKALGAERGKVIIATKFGVNWDQYGNTYKDCGPARIRKALEESLKRLKIDCIPLYQIHWHDNNTRIEDTLEALIKCREEGKIRYIGCSNFSIELLLQASKVYRIETLQCKFNIKEDLDIRILRYVKKNNMGVIAYNVLLRGFFSGKYSFKSKFTKEDTRTKDVNFRGEKFKANLEFVKILEEIGKHHDKTPAQVAIRWVLDNHAISCAIIGAKTKEQVEENTDIDWRLKRQDKEFIKNYKKRIQQL